MASVNRRGKSWRAHVSFGGATRTKTFKTKAEASDWAHQAEQELRALAGGMSLTHTVGDAFNRYAREVSPGKRGERWELLRLAALGRDELAAVKLCEVRPADVAQWRDRRLKSVTGSTVNREMNLISNVFSVAVKEWHWLKESPTKQVRRPKESPPRDRLISDREVELLLVALGYQPGLDTVGARVGRALLFALETAMRASEICSLDKTAVSGKVARLAMTKNGFPREVPLSKRAREIWEEAGSDGFGVLPRQIDANFRKARKRAGLDDVHFHDTRHTALTRMAWIPGMDPLKLAKISGHRDINQLAAYFNTPAEQMADLLG